MDWLIGPAGGARASGALTLVGEHLLRHAAQPEAVGPALDRVGARLEAALASGAEHNRVRVDWTRARPTLEVAAVRHGAALPPGVAPGAGVVATQRSAVDDLLAETLMTVELPVERRVQEVFTSGPPPTPLVDVDPRRDGVASVAVALLAAREAHPTVTATQSAGLAGAILAQAALDPEGPATAERAADLIAELHGALGSDAVAGVTDDRVVEVSIGRCPFGPGVTGAASLCHVTAGLTGQIAARVHGSSTVVLDETMSLGDAGCHLYVRLDPDGEDVRGESHQWPAVATASVDPAPHLDLSLSLPRESGSVPVVRRLAAQALRAFGVEDEDIDDVQLAITEACANVVEHATESDTYEVKVELASDRCAITVVDQGQGFDATTLPEIPSSDAESGRGLVLMRALVDNVAFQSQPQAGAVVHMVKTLRFERDHPLRQRMDPPRD
jgi:serine/threonine-protein kinase RsbW